MTQSTETVSLLQEFMSIACDADVAICDALHNGGEFTSAGRGRAGALRHRITKAMVRYSQEHTRASTNKDETIAKLRAEIINTPETADFMAGVPLEAAHQRERWGVDHDAGKSPFDWFWLIGYLSQKAAASVVADDVEKAKHHTISTAAALANWHAALTGADTRMRPGIGPGNGGEKPGSAYSLTSTEKEG